MSGPKGGRPPVPTALRKLRGNPRQHAMNPHEPALTTAAEAFDEPPAQLQGDELACSEYRRLAPILRQARVVTEGDRQTLATACQQFSIYLGALAQAPPERRVVLSHNKFPIISPYMNLAMKAVSQCIRLWDALGLTPASRSRITTAPPPVEGGDPFAEFDDLPPRPMDGPTFEGRRTIDDEPKPS